MIEILLEVNGLFSLDVFVAVVVVVYTSCPAAGEGGTLAVGVGVVGEVVASLLVENSFDVLCYLYWLDFPTRLNAVETFPFYDHGDKSLKLDSLQMEYFQLCYLQSDILFLCFFWSCSIKKC